ncbi:MAG: hypothetical protein U1G05_05250 [Kiritimatiellia bacterium]
MTVQGKVTGGGNLRKEDSGVLLLNNTGNDYGGVTKVILGEIRSGASGVLPDTTELVMAGGTVNLNGFSETVESVSGGSGTVTGTAATTLTLLTTGVEVLLGRDLRRARPQSERERHPDPGRDDQHRLHGQRQRRHPALRSERPLGQPPEPPPPWSPSTPGPPWKASVSSTPE